MIIIERGAHKFPKVLMEISDYPYASELSPEAYDSLKETCDMKIKKYMAQKRYMAMRMAKNANDEDDKKSAA